jgi:hypothetical protein
MLYSPNEGVDWLKTRCQRAWMSSKVGGSAPVLEFHEAKFWGCISNGWRGVVLQERPVGKVSAD